MAKSNDLKNILQIKTSLKIIDTENEFNLETFDINAYLKSYFRQYPIKPESCDVAFENEDFSQWVNTKNLEQNIIQEITPNLKVCLHELNQRSQHETLNISHEIKKIVSELVFNQQERFWDGEEHYPADPKKMIQTLNHMDSMSPNAWRNFFNRAQYYSQPLIELLNDPDFNKVFSEQFGKFLSVPPDKAIKNIELIASIHDSYEKAIATILENWKPPQDKNGLIWSGDIES